MLAKNNINISMISTTEIKVLGITNEENLENAVKGLHSAFDLENS